MLSSKSKVEIKLLYTCLNIREVKADNEISKIDLRFIMYTKIIEVVFWPNSASSVKIYILIDWIIF